MSRKAQHVVPTSNGGWSVKKEGASKATQTFRTQHEAIERGIVISKNQKAELFIHKNDGTIRQRNSYGSDPFPPRG